MSSSSSSLAASSTTGLVHSKDAHNLAANAHLSPVHPTARAFFVQSPPRIGNAYTEDGFLRETLARLVPRDMLSKFEPDLVKFGQRVAKHIGPLGHDSDRCPPKLESIDGWGVRTDRVQTSAAWDRLQEIAVEEGLMAIGYERAEFAHFARVYQFAKLYLFSGASAVADCPLAMTNGAAKLVDESSDAGLKSRCFSRLTSRDVATAVTSGQWMTERTGGSDVSRSETVAVQLADSADGRDFELHGYKYFTSSINSAMAFALARVVSPDSAKVVDGSKGLSLFQVETHRDDGSPNNIVIHKLKDKLGTKGVPTAELELRGTRARLVGEIGRGVPHIATLFNLTRIHNATAAAAGMRRIIAAARDYAPRRTALGASLADNALHLQTIAEMETHCRAAVLMLMDSVLLLGETEVPPNGDKARAEAAARTLRIATPLLKLFTAKQAMIVMSEGIESLGAHGYMEDSGIPRLLRDAQVLPIWEGTTNVLALDMLRVVSHDARAVTDFMARAEARAAEKSRPALGAARTAIIKALGALAQSGDKTPAATRAVAMALSAHYCAALTSEAAAASRARTDEYVADRWANVLLPSFVRDLEWLVERRPNTDLLRRVAFDMAEDGANRNNAGKDRDARGSLRPRF
jgi:putative acyl-CoA dehydrogenase